MSAHASVQSTHLHVESIEDDVLRVRGPQYRAVLEVGAVNFRMLGEAEQEAITAGFAAFLNSLTFPIQMLVRVLLLDLEPYLRTLEERAIREEDVLGELARDHVGYLRRLARSRTLLERRFYLVVPSESAGPAVRHWRPFGKKVPALEAEAAHKQLTFRCDEIERELGRCGLAASRLPTVELAQLFYACWCPDLSRVQRLRRDVAAYVATVVQAVGADRSRS